MLQRIMKEDPAHLHWLWQRHSKGTGLLKFHDIKDKRYWGKTSVDNARLNGLRGLAFQKCMAAVLIIKKSHYLLTLIVTAFWLVVR